MPTIIDLDIKNIPLTEFMKALGQEQPVAADGNLRIYNAPYDSEHAATMVINTETNLWRDTKSGAYGGIYDLAYELTGSCSMSELTNRVRETLDFNNKPIARYYTLNYGLGGDGTTMIFRAKSFKLLDELDNVVVSASYNTRGALAGSDKYVGIIGNPILCHYDLIIDYVHKKLFARKNNNPDDDCFISSREQMSYIDRTDICDGWVINSLYDNGIAQRAGFERGDIILSINGRPVKDITWNEQRKGLGLNGRTTYEVKKKNREIVTYILDIDKEIIGDKPPLSMPMSPGLPRGVLRLVP